MLEMLTQTKANRNGHTKLGSLNPNTWEVETGQAIQLTEKLVRDSVSKQTVESP